MAAVRLPDELVARFRNIAQERLDRIEDGWGRVLTAPDDHDACAELKRELHTLST